MRKFYQTIKLNIHITIQYSTDKTNLGHAWSPMAIDGIRWPSMTLGRSHGPIASWSLMGLSRAIGEHRGSCLAQISFVCLVLSIKFDIFKSKIKLTHFSQKIPHFNNNSFAILFNFIIKYNNEFYTQMCCLMRLAILRV